MKIAFLDYKSLGDDMDFDRFSSFGEVVKYNMYNPDEVGDRLDDAEVVIVNKLPINEQTIGRAKKLKLVCVTATGTNNLDKPYLGSRGIEWRNVAGYSTQCVSQHTFALLFYVLEKLRYYDDYVKSGGYASDKMFTHFARQFEELSGKTWGIAGLGAIGSNVAKIATAFGCSVIYYSTSGKNDNGEYERVSFDELLSRSDIVSVHAPLNDSTYRLFGVEAFRKMKKTSIFINVGRGPIVDEAALANAILNEEIAAAGIDVLEKEPMSPDNPLLKIQDSSRLIVTPHIAWAGVQTRERLLDIIYGQIEEFVR